MGRDTFRQRCGRLPAFLGEHELRQGILHRLARLKGLAIGGFEIVDIPLRFVATRPGVDGIQFIRRLIRH
jgi:hypothetical protein